jgi:hypothetical protein
MALFHAMEARAQASMGKEEDTTAALLTAERWHQQANPADDDPEWIRYFDSAELHAEFAHCFRDLGQGDLAGQHAEISLREAGSVYVRSTSFVRTVLSTAHLLDGNVEKALHEARAVFDIAGQLKSMRVRAYLDEFRKRLTTSHPNDAAVRAFLEFAQEKLPSEDAPLTNRLVVA